VGGDWLTDIAVDHPRQLNWGRPFWVGPNRRSPMRARNLLHLARRSTCCWRSSPRRAGAQAARVRTLGSNVVCVCENELSGATFAGIYNANAGAEGTGKSDPFSGRLDMAGREQTDAAAYGLMVDGAGHGRQFSLRVQPIKKHGVSNLDHSISRVHCGLYRS
jgi:hypothetical protein